VERVYQDIFTNQQLIIGSKNNADRPLKRVIGNIRLSEIQVNHNNKLCSILWWTSAASTKDFAVKLSTL
jgi:hypothetical protein